MSYDVFGDLIKQSQDAYNAKIAAFRASMGTPDLTHRNPMGFPELEVNPDYKFLNGTSMFRFKQFGTPTSSNTAPTYTPKDNPNLNYGAQNDLESKIASSLKGNAPQNINFNSNLQSNPFTQSVKGK